MRVTERMIFEGAARSSGKASERLQRAVTEAATGLRVQHPGDDSAAAAGIVSHKLGLGRAQAIGEAAGRAESELYTTDSALGSAADLFGRARELAMQLSNSTYDATQRAGAAVEVDQLIKGLVGVLNVSVGNRYVFGGLRDDAPPFDAAGNYLGDDGVRQVEVAPGVLEDASVRADVAFKGVGGGADAFATLQALADALRANDPQAVAATLGGFDQVTNQISVARTTAGSSATVFLAAQTATADVVESETKSLADLQEVDIVEASTRLALAQRALDAALSASAKSFELTLLDKL